ncbi:hypothetical protein BCR34DRAFT_325433 [Clohesyomyces aquaticus]|uniref:DUF7730 domain-containing protein n=1 Tax=Clohesyomyces aquaticus TaxID=1231657 RepID=A0A1Y1ZMY3_9PLEO|nr:hypothetical protein BCR34DRAFT_325433 [Clohesyomyces aquaticus]
MYVGAWSRKLSAFCPSNFLNRRYPFFFEFDLCSVLSFESSLRGGPFIGVVSPAYLLSLSHAHLFVVYRGRPKTNMLYNINASVALYRELAKESYAAQKPEPLPKLRFRELSPLSRSTGRAKRTGTANESDSPQTCFQKPQNLLVDHLPPEIRLRVWKYAVGGQTLHILRKMAKVGHRVCRGQNCPDCAQCDFALSIDTSGIAEPFTETYKSTEASLLSLLLTCHQM